MPLFVVTASRLRDGAIVWLGAGPAWHTRFSMAQTLTEADLDTALAFGASEVRAQRVVGVYKVAVDEVGGIAVPHSTREKIRAMGPSVRPDFAYETTGA
jgi:sulfite reductase (NADPH) hemoprotein beta-component